VGECVCIVCVCVEGGVVYVVLIGAHVQIRGSFVQIDFFLSLIRFYSLSNRPHMHKRANAHTRARTHTHIHTYFECNLILSWVGGWVGGFVCVRECVGGCVFVRVSVGVYAVLLGGNENSHLLLISSN